VALNTITLTINLQIITYLLGQVSVDTKACLDLPSSTKGSLVIYGTIDSPLPDTVYHIVAEIYEIKVNGTETCPSKYVIICKFMVRVMVFNATFNNIIYRGGRHR
jgi:hypothetical protein